MLKFLPRIPERHVYLITKSTPEQYSNSRSKIKEIGDFLNLRTNMKKLSQVTVFDDILGSLKSRYIDHFSIRGRHNNLEILYLSQS